MDFPILQTATRTNRMPASQIANLEAEQYRMIGKHSAIKVCSWTKQSLRAKGACYKKRFYGIDSWRCIQFSPTVQFCTENCSFCWRTLRYHNNTGDDWDSPKFIVDGMIAEHTKVLRGFAGNPKTPKKMFSESQLPKHVAISLSGEPTLYPRLPELIDEIHARGMTTFLVSNGTQPEMIRKLIDHPPTQLYITVAGSTPEILKKTANPILPDTWERLHESLSLLKHFPISVMRLTLVKDLNMFHPELFAAIAEQNQPTFVEAKGYVHVGGSQQRLAKEHMPQHEDILAFAEQIQAQSSYRVRDQMFPSRCVLLSKPETKQPNWSRMLAAAEMEMGGHESESDGCATCG